MGFLNKGKLNTFFWKTFSFFVAKAKRHVCYAPFNKRLPSVAIIYDPSHDPNFHLSDYLGYLTDNFNIILFLPESYRSSPEINIEKCWRVYYFGSRELQNPIKFYFSWFLLSAHPIRFVLINANVGRFLMHYLWQKHIASLLLIGENHPLEGKTLNRVIAYATRVIYDRYETFMKTLTNALWAFPDSVDYLVPPDSKNAEELQNYISRITNIGYKAQKQLIQENKDAGFLSHSPEFDIPYWSGKNKPRFNRFRYARHYVRNYKSGASAARPRAGFHPGIYAENHDLGEERVDPFVHYLKSDKPDGKWNWNVLTSPDIVSSPDIGLKIALHIHAYYPHMLEAILEKLRANKIRPDLFISVKNESDKLSVQLLVDKYEGKTVIEVVPNRGRDIGPLFTEFGKELVQHYEIIGHIHTKQSLHETDRKMVANWNTFLMTNLLGDGKTIKMADVILHYMQTHEKTALIFPDDKYAVGWAGNYQAGLELAKRLKIETLPKYIVFPTGTMFWAKADVLKPFVNLDLQWNDYPQEPLALDGTFLHAIERMFTLTCYQKGYDIVTTYLPHKTR